MHGDMLHGYFAICQSLGSTQSKKAEKRFIQDTKKQGKFSHLTIDSLHHANQYSAHPNPF